MKIASFDRKVSLTIKVAGTKFTQSFNPGNRVLFSDAAAEGIEQMLGRDVALSDFDSFYCQHVKKPADWRGKRVLFYVSQGAGDQLMATSLSHYFTKMLGAQCYQLSDKVHEPIWQANKFIQGEPLSYPLALDSVLRLKGRAFFDWAFFIEDLYHWEDCAEQLNSYDVMFAQAGIDAVTVPDRFKSPVFSVTEEDISKKLDWLQHVSHIVRPVRGIDISRGYIFFQLRASNASRTLSIEANTALLAGLNKVGLPILCADDEPLTPATKSMLDQFSNALDVSQTIDGVRLYGTIVTGATMVAGPDSSAVHFAASASVPCLSVWGPFAPQQRIRYYNNQLAIHHTELCSHSPCTNYHPELPYTKCPRKAQQVHCECFAGLNQVEVDAAIKSLMKRATL